MKAVLSVVLLSLIGCLSTKTQSRLVTGNPAAYLTAITPSGNITGTCFAYKRKDKYTYFLTAAHILRDATSARINETTKAEIECVDLKTDIAVLRSVTDKFPILSLRRTEPVVGEEVIASGCSVGESGMMHTVGLVCKEYSENKEETRLSRSWACSAAVTPGNSGSPIVSTYDGKVVGMCIALSGLGFQLVFHMNIFISSETLCKWLDKRGLS